MFHSDKQDNRCPTTVATSDTFHESDGTTPTQDPQKGASMVEACEDKAATVALATRELELRANARYLVKRINALESRAKALRGATPSPSTTGELEDLIEAKNACRWQTYELTAEAIGNEYTAGDVAEWCQRAVEMDAAHPRLTHSTLVDLLHVRQVPNAPLRAAVLALDSGGQAELCRQVHKHLAAAEAATGENYGSKSLTSSNGKPYTLTLRRWLGIDANPAGSRQYKGSMRLFITYEQAQAIAHALDMNPHQAGL